MIVQMQLANLIGTGGYDNDPALLSRFQRIQQQIRQQKMPQMIDTEIHFEAVCRKLTFDSNDSGIINQHVKYRMFC
ncbi:hypothetical protein D3C72_2076850 [compost metagenome]